MVPEFLFQALNLMNKTQKADGECDPRWKYDRPGRSLKKQRNLKIKFQKGRNLSSLVHC